MRATAARLLAFAATSLRSPVARLSFEGRAALLSQLAAGGSLTDKSKALIDLLTIANALLLGSSARLCSEPCTFPPANPGAAAPR